MITAEPQLIERLALWAIKERIPFLGHFGLTRHCNLMCSFCLWGKKLKPRGFMPQFLFKKALSEMKEMGTFEIELTGGDPLLHPHLPDFIRIATDLRFVIAITTNGLRLTERNLSAIKEGLIAHVSVSIHGAKPETHDRIVGRPGAWNISLRNMEKLLDSGVRTIVCFVITKENHQEVKNAKALFESMGARFQMVLKLYNPFCLEEVESLKLRGHALADLMGLFPDPPVCPHPCGAFMNAVYINPNGDVWPCISFPFNLGNIGKTSFREIWEGINRETRALRRNLVRAREKGVYRGVEYFCPSISRGYDGSLGGLEPHVKEIIDAWLNERNESAKSNFSLDEVVSPDRQIAIKLGENHGFVPEDDVAFRLLRGREETYLVLWKRSTRRYAALEGPWAEAVSCILSGQRIKDALKILESSFKGFRMSEAITDMEALLSEIAGMGFIKLAI
ncbi:MAG: radical SAM protein [candidate division WOR-3 bacterium]